jgi:hypothetical protein
MKLHRADPAAVVRPRSIGVSSVLLALALAIGLPGPAAAADGAPGPRLKFRAKGPVCACTSELDEQAIARGLSARLGPRAAAPASGASAVVLPPPSRPPQPSQEQRR